MKIGAVMFFTTDSMRPAPLARALEERGFESLWVPEHTHIPSSRKTAYPAGGGLIRPGSVGGGPESQVVVEVDYQLIGGRCSRPFAVGDVVECSCRFG